MTTAAYANANLAIEDRVNDLIERMQLDEKVAQLGAVEFPHLVTGRALRRRGGAGCGALTASARSRA